MVDELTQDLAALGCEVHVISPYYNKNNKGESGYLANDNIRWIQNIQQWIGAERCEVGVHEGYVNDVHLVSNHLLIRESSSKWETNTFRFSFSCTIWTTSLTSILLVLQSITNKSNILLMCSNRITSIPSQGHRSVCQMCFGSIVQDANDTCCSSYQRLVHSSSTCLC